MRWRGRCRYTERADVDIRVERWEDYKNEGNMGSLKEGDGEGREIREGNTQGYSVVDDSAQGEL